LRSLETVETVDPAVITEAGRRESMWRMLLSEYPAAADRTFQSAYVVSLGEAERAHETLVRDDALDTAVRVFRMRSRVRGDAVGDCARDIALAHHRAV